MKNKLKYILLISLTVILLTGCNNKENKTTAPETNNQIENKDSGNTNNTDTNTHVTTHATSGSTPESYNGKIKEIEISIDYPNNLEVEFEYDLGMNERKQAKLEDEVNKTYHNNNEFAYELAGKLSSINYSDSEDVIIKNVLNILGLKDNFIELEIEIHYYGKNKIEIKR